jgi:energy-coupling factor transporter ATP-binding protein EcfA2
MEVSVAIDGSRQNRFARLELSAWRQFRRVEIEFDERLTVLTGQNGSGKTTLLQVLGRHFTAWTQLLGVPRSTGTGSLDWQLDTRGGGPQREVGRLEYRSTGDERLAAVITANASQSYELQYNGQEFVPGLMLQSHRQPGAYRHLGEIPSSFSPANLILQQYWNEILTRFAGNYSAKSPALVMKESLLAAGLYGPGNAWMEPNTEAHEVWTGFQEVLRAVLPESLGFEEMRLNPPEIVLHTKTGDFLLEAMSGGISAIVEMSWQIFLQSRSYSHFTACIDEPENHLHPSLQRSLIPGLLQAFPRISFIVASHSPFIVTSVPESNVYALDYVDAEVESRLLDYASKAASSDETLRRVLGLETTVPLWVEQRVAQAIQQFPTTDPSDDDFRALYNSLAEAGLRDEFPAALDALLNDGAP